MECLGFALRKGLLVTMCNDGGAAEAWNSCAGGIAVDLSLPVAEAASTVMGVGMPDAIPTSRDPVSMSG
ncbi:hypothetical protein J2T57_002007 [Natronocella acetinitrilica]|uniref:Uncharacterized protein n=1 Tax=Natronocella acetinitrilica TaxID=414046 RepID=A0AAE3KBK7_9GAMM|nr:hypothetical protein [Natronocella acetinitrilica]MCP1674869.1 hypothetical protein [Natronocella acetinitrilica]